MSRDVPRSIGRYFEAASAGDAEAASYGFAIDAVVHDEGRDHVGRQAIRDWVQDTVRRYATRFEVESTSESSDATLVVAKLTGTFPGSPIRLRFVFQLADELIVRLDIKP